MTVPVCMRKPFRLSSLKYAMSLKPIYKSCKKCRLVAIMRSCLQNPEKLPAAVRFLTRLSAKAEDVSFLIICRNASII